MNALTIDWDKLINRFLPSFGRKAITRAFMKVLLSPAIDLFTQLTVIRQQYIDQLSINILTDTLQNKLRADYPDIGAFQCHVVNQWDTLPQPYDQFIGEHHKQQYSYGLGEAGYTAEYDWFASERSLPFDYVIIIPVGHSAAQSQIDAFLNKFKPAGKRFQLNFQNI